jgi:hypothetical protein
VKTDDLIDALARDLQPVSVGALGRVLAFSLASGLVLSAALILIAHGLRPDLSPALRLPIFWIKSVYPLALASTGIGAMISVARPGGVPMACGMAALSIYVVLVVLGLWQLHVSPATDYPALIFGSSYWFCPLIIVASALPVFAANIWFLRRAAPTHLGLAGFVAGMTAGAVGAWTYSWGCTENGLPFLALWYTLGIVLCGLIGALTARRLLRW